MDYDYLLELAKKRRTIRNFKPGRIPDDDIDKILEIARWAPSGFNSQPWDFVVIRKDDLKKRIIDILQEHLPSPLKEKSDATKESGAANPVDKLVMKTKWTVAPFSDSSVFIILYGDPRARVGLPSGEKTRLEGMFRSIFEASLANAFLLMHLAAASLGLAAQWWTMIAAPEVQAKVKPLLGVPEDFIAYDMLVLGYPGAVPRPKLLRSKEKMIHIDDCGPEDYRSDEEVKAFAKKTRAWTIAQHLRAYR